MEHGLMTKRTNGMTKIKNTKSYIRDVNIIDIILIDHRYLKECIELLTDDHANNFKKIEMAKGFLNILKKHSEAEKEIVYAPLKADEDFHFNILEALVEHGIVDDKISELRPKVIHAKVLKDELAVELKVFAELVKHHIKEEESELLPKMKELIEEDTLKIMGHEFMKLRKMTTEDISNYPLLQEELVTWKDEVQKVSSQFLSKMDKYVENLRH
jgi:hemerythrin-like domain-containing protein